MSTAACRRRLLKEDFALCQRPAVDKQNRTAATERVCQYCSVMHHQTIHIRKRKRNCIKYCEAKKKKNATNHDILMVMRDMNTDIGIRNKGFESCKGQQGI